MHTSCLASFAPRSTSCSGPAVLCLQVSRPMRSSHLAACWRSRTRTFNTPSTWRRAQTLYAIADSPVGLAAWLHDPISLDMIRAGRPDARRRPQQLHTLWLTNTAVSRLYRENTFNYFSPKGVIPVAVSVFLDRLYQAPRSWAEKAYPKLIHYNKLAKGGHFAAWEQPKLFSGEIRAGFRPLAK